MGDLWQVKVGGLERLMTPYDLHGAFSRGEMDGRTAVRRPGTTAWSTLTDAMTPASGTAPNAAPNAASNAAPNAAQAPAAKESRTRVLALFVVVIAGASYVFFYDRAPAQPAQDAAPVVAAPPPGVANVEPPPVVPAGTVLGMGPTSASEPAPPTTSTSAPRRKKSGSMKGARK
jgi:hypothetical protein